ncbi:MAG: hypothetical protein LBE13_08870, partial [Bacteroidales bacterium]|nr:hypothetical protein [Bacteroidales bacterium]
DQTYPSHKIYPAFQFGDRLNHYFYSLFSSSFSFKISTYIIYLLNLCGKDTLFFRIVNKKVINRSMPYKTTD